VAVDAVIRLYGSVDGVETATRDLEGAR
jgi:hypothetical protein